MAEKETLEKLNNLETRLNELEQKLNRQDYISVQHQESILDIRDSQTSAEAHYIDLNSH